MAQAGGIICATCPVADRAVCSALSPDDRAELARIGHHRRYTRGETIIAAGDPNTVCATLTRGAAKMSTIERDGTERIVALVHPAGMLGQMFAPAATLHVTALTDSEACLFPRGQFAALRDARPALAARLLSELGRELDESRSLIDLISKRQARGGSPARNCTIAPPVSSRPVSHTIPSPKNSFQPGLRPSPGATRAHQAGTMKAAARKIAKIANGIASPFSPNAAHMMPR
ncbi:Crp/Fnr family transcriptional regulator [Sphingomonas koreensis]|jgi:CRP/FNR family transcriptional regulator|uniref:Crp/Fnr family transcriptional regulator n=1 Tax=Sphingomonas koreensis TaxID=93064 RepID=A0A1L6J8X3_9SPHN|nr:Crp/Fnr family transcriptional regulator [Sphingomonas koreensis]APR52286.1 hypothetical protein BRX40_07465 [Sphingomonas koreensis]MDC7811424.1 Crp/Fnr family transcriptional regulator [Sphingomonas koreensis]RSU19820.1 Crp/Fnr family transcriptional regulator [Sphingomonas koreensis]RSU26608.1 Crp/Fnr family transcriptional regulator [Sphingomonas koreensis]RSU27389.1 Crp/Fnr family transcriptional regulator [Sphingomonas koreensis]